MRLLPPLLKKMTPNKFFKQKAPRLQARVFLPDWHVYPVRSKFEHPPEVVEMRVSVEMGRIDVKNYIESIYQVPVDKVNVRIAARGYETKNHRDIVTVSKLADDYKVAYVTLAEGNTFKFPVMFPDDDDTVDRSSEEEQQDAKDLEKESQKEELEKMTEMQKKSADLWLPGS